MKCIFPFIIDGLRRNMCFQGGGGLACATAIDANGNKIGDSYADDDCFLGDYFHCNLFQLFPATDRGLQVLAKYL